MESRNPSTEAHRAKTENAANRITNDCRGALKKLRTGLFDFATLPAENRRHFSARCFMRTLSVRPAIGVRLIASFPPAGPALRARANNSARAPGSGSPVPAFAERVSFMTAARENLPKQNPPERSAREGPRISDVPARVMRCRSHEPSGRCRTAKRRFRAAHCNVLCFACSPHVRMRDPMSREGRGLYARSSALSRAREDNARQSSSSSSSS